MEKEAGKKKKCDKCNEEFEEGYGPGLPIECSNCKKLICEMCEVQKCDEGKHTCPFCDNSLGECSPISE